MTNILTRAAYVAILIGWQATAAAGAGAAGTALAVEAPAIEAAVPLKPGDFVWHAAAAGRGPVTVTVSIPEQRAYVTRGGALVGVTTVSTGKPGHDTPAGEYTILQKNKDHRSNLYANAPMPYMQRLTWDGIALHAGKIPGRPASHGCVRLPLAFARRLFAMTELGATVVVLDGAAADRFERRTPVLAASRAPAQPGPIEVAGVFGP